jgi:hypothetical protein
MQWQPFVYEQISSVNLDAYLMLDLNQYIVTCDPMEITNYNLYMLNGRVCEKCMKLCILVHGCGLYVNLFRCTEMDFLNH